MKGVNDSSIVMAHGHVILFDEIQNLNNLSDPIFVVGNIEVLTDVDPSS